MRRPRRLRRGTQSRRAAPTDPSRGPRRESSRGFGRARTRHEPDDDSDEREAHALAHHLRGNGRALRAERHPHADLPRAARDQEGLHPVEPGHDDRLGAAHLDRTAERVRAREEPTRERLVDDRYTPSGISEDFVEREISATQDRQAERAEVPIADRRVERQLRAGRPSFVSSAGSSAFPTRCRGPASTGRARLVRNESRNCSTRCDRSTTASAKSSAPRRFGCRHQTK